MGDRVYENGNAWFRPRLLRFIQYAFHTSVVNTTNFRRVSEKYTQVYVWFAETFLKLIFNAEFVLHVQSNALRNFGGNLMKGEITLLGLHSIIHVKQPFCSVYKFWYNIRPSSFKFNFFFHINNKHNNKDCKNKILNFR